MDSNQIGLEPAQATGKPAAAPLTACTLMVCSAIAIFFVLVSWAVGGQPYLHSFFGDVVLGGLVACFLISAACYHASRLPQG